MKNTAIICLSPHNGGMELDSIKLAKKLSKYGDIILVAKKDAFIASQKKEYTTNHNIKLETIDFKSTLSASIIIKARDIIKKYGIKNVIFFGASELKSLYFAFLGLDINLIVRHGTTKSKPKKDWFHKLIYSKVNYHVSICKHLLYNVRYIIPFGKYTKEKLIYSSFEFQKPQHTSNHKLKLLHIGRIARGKGQIDAIKSCEVLIENNIDFEFDIVGGFDDGFKDEFLEFYNNLAYKEKINLVGFSNNIQKYLNSADIFLFPSWGEGLSNAFIEALSSELICIAYSNTSFPELKDLGFSFELAKDKDIDDLKIKLYNVVSNLTISQEQIKDNYKKAKEIFSTTREMKEYLSILDC